jgi:phosphate transport system protein
MGRDLLKTFEGTVLWTGIESLRHKIERDVPPAMLEQLREAREVFYIAGGDPARYAARPRLLSTLTDAITKCREVEIEEECLKILALHQPVAIDLRFIVAAMKINNDLERMGDLARNIAKRVTQLEGGDPYDLPPEIRTMATQAQEMVRQCLDAVVKRDPTLARQVREEDDIVDEARQRIQRRVLQGIKDHPENVENLLRINSVSKHIERIADMATNIAEDVVYMVEGDIVRHRSEA